MFRSRVEVLSDIGVQSGHFERSAPIPERLGRLTTSSDTVASRHRRGVDRTATLHESDEFRHNFRVRPAVAPGLLVHLECFVALRIPAGPPVPKLDMRAVFAIPEILDSPLCPDDRVVPPVVGREVTLLVAGQHAVVEFHLNYAEVFDIDDRVELFLSQRRPVIAIDAGVASHLRPVAIRDVPVYAQFAPGVDPLGVYVGSKSGVLYGSRDEGESWYEVAGSLPPILSVSSHVV